MIPVDRLGILAAKINIEQRLSLFNVINAGELGSGVRASGTEDLPDSGPTEAEMETAAEMPEMENELQSGLDDSDSEPATGDETVHVEGRRIVDVR